MNKQGSLWFVAGLGVGAVVGLMYAPTSGVRMRASAAAKAKEGQRVFSRWRDDADTKVNDAAERGRQSARRASARISAALDASRKTFLG